MVPSVGFDLGCGGGVVLRYAPVPTIDPWQLISGYIGSTVADLKVF
jgi:hypothetical protein